MRDTFIFDMDGLLANTEPLWKKAEIFCFAEVGVQLTHEMCSETMGLRVDEAVSYWVKKYGLNSGSRQLVEKVLDQVESLILQEAKLLPGVRETLDLLQAEGFRMAVASSSYYRIIHRVLATTGIAAYFEAIHSAQEEAKGKPHPAVYQGVLRKLGVEPDRAVAFEDSVNGVRSAVAAGLFTIAIPAPEDLHDPRYREASVVISSMTEFSTDLIRG